MDKIYNLYHDSFEESTHDSRRTNFLDEKIVNKDIMQIKKFTYNSLNDDEQMPRKTFMPWQGKAHPCFEGYDNKQMSEYYFCRNYKFTNYKSSNRKNLY